MRTQSTERTITEAVGVLRISQDPSDKRAGITTQRNAINALAPILGWKITDWYVDNNRSGWKVDKDTLAPVRRPEFERLIADMRTGKLAGMGVLVFDQDRISRLAWQQQQFRDYALARNMSVAIVERGVVDLTSPWDWGLGGIRAQEESDVKSKRIRGAVYERAMAGRANGYVAYGWQREYVVAHGGVVWRDVIDDEQAAVVREIAERLIAGEAVVRIAADLSARAQPTPRNATTWNPCTIRSLIKRPANIGQRVYRGAVLPGVKAEAPPILSADVYRRATRLLADPTRRTFDDPRVRNLLSRIARCDECETPVRAKGQNGDRKYLCPVGHTSVDADAADDEVETHLLAYLDTVDMADVFAESESDVIAAANQVESLQASIRELASEKDDGTIGAEEYRQRRARLQTKLDDAQTRAQAGAAPGRSVIQRLALAHDVRAEWGSLVIELKRQAVAGVLDVRLLRVGRGRRGVPVAERVSIVPLP